MELQVYKNHPVIETGIEEWTFKAVAKGNVAITLEYIRPWEKDVPPIKKSVYQVTVK